MDMGIGEAAAAEGAKSAGEAAAAESAVGAGMTEAGVGTAVGAGAGELTATDMALTAGAGGATASGYGATASELAAMNGVEYTGAEMAGSGLAGASYGESGTGGTAGGASGLGAGTDGARALNGYDVAWSSTPQETMAGSDIGLSQGVGDSYTANGVGSELATDSPSGLADTFSAAKDSQMANEAGVGMTQPMPGWAQSIKDGYTGLQTALKPYKGVYQAANGLYDMYASGQKADALKQQTSSLANMYQPGTPEYDLQMKQLAARDAAAGRRSQYGPRANELAGIMAKNRSSVMTSPGYTSMLNGQLNNQYGGVGKAAAGLSGMFQ